MTEGVTPVCRNRWLALAVLCTGELMVILDGTIVGVALPSIQEDLGFSQARLAWIVNAYLIALAGFLLLAGRLGDLVGRKLMFVSGLSAFTAASVLCGVSNSQGMLIGARFLQGAGAALSAAVILGSIVTLFPRPDEQVRAIGAFSFTSAAGASIGLLLGGVLTQGISWHWIFFVNVPIGAIAALLALRLLDREEGLGIRAGADALGAVLVTSGLMLGVYTIVDGPEQGWTSTHTLGFGGLALALLVAFVVRQATARQPLLPLRILASRRLSGGGAVLLLTVGGMLGFQYLTSLYLQRGQAYSAGRTGVAFLPVAVVIAIMALGFSARLNVRFGGRNVLLAGLGLVGVALVVMSRVPVEADYVRHILPAMVVFGCGAGLALPTTFGIAMSGAAPTDSGLASGLVNTIQQVGGAIGVAVILPLATALTTRLTEEGDPLAEALVGGYRRGYAIAAGFTVVALVLAIVVLAGQVAGQVAGEPAGEAAGEPADQPDIETANAV